MSIEAMKQAREALKCNKRLHYYCEDTWYSCPKHEDGCANEAEGDECNCGADKSNAQIDAAITALDTAIEAAEKQEQLHREGYWCANLTCKKCYSADFRFKHQSTTKDSLIVQSTAPVQEPVANEMPLHIIRKWPEGFQERLQHVWLDVVSFIPEVKLWDLQRTLAEFGFTMKVYDGAAPPAAPVQEPVTRWAVFCGGCRKEWSVPYQHPGKSICAECESKLREKNGGVERQPLTGEQIDAIDEANWEKDHKVWGIHNFARAIEAAHGITGEKK